MKRIIFDEILPHFSAEKTYHGDGYYRIRQVDDRTYELAFLVADACGSTSVHPQITLWLENNDLVPTKLIDMGTAPTKFIQRDITNAAWLDNQLEQLINRFKSVI